MGPDSFLKIVDRLLPQKGKWVQERPIVIGDYLTHLPQRYPHPKYLLGLPSYVPRLKDRNSPLDLGFARWMREVHHLGFRFYVVKDQPGTANHCGV
jgi:hypothetical protein